MPIVRIELFSGRDDAKKEEVAKEITRVLQATTGIPPEDTTVIFSEVRPSNWFVAGGSFAAKAGSE